MKVDIKKSVIVSVLFALFTSSCKKDEIYNYQRDDYAIIEVLHNNKPVAMVGAVPGDSVRFGDYTVVYKKRK